MTDAIPPIPEVPPALREAAQLTKLIPFVGAGASKLAGCPDWNEFADDALKGCFSERPSRNERVRALPKATRRGRWLLDATTSSGVSTVGRV